MQYVQMLQFQSLFVSVFVIIVIMYFINASVNIFGALKQMLLRLFVHCSTLYYEHFQGKKNIRTMTVFIHCSYKIKFINILVVQLFQRILHLIKVKEKQNILYETLMELQSGQEEHLPQEQQNFPQDNLRFYMYVCVCDLISPPPLRSDYTLTSLHS